MKRGFVALYPDQEDLIMHQQRRRKKRHTHGLKTVEITRGKNGYGFTISGQQPCILSCIVSGSPADRAGLKTGDYLMSVNVLNVSNASHDDVVRLIGSSTGLLTLQIAENYNDTDSSDEEISQKPKSKYPTRARLRQGHSRERQLKDNEPAKEGFGKERAGHNIPNRYVANAAKKSAAQLRARALSPTGRLSREVEGASFNQERTAFYQMQTRGIENMNPLSVAVYPRRQKHSNSNIGGATGGGEERQSRSHGTKHTIISRDGRVTKTHGNVDFDFRDGPFVQNHNTQGHHTHHQHRHRGHAHQGHVTPNSAHVFDLHGQIQPQQPGMTAQELSTILYPSLQPHVSRNSLHELEDAEDLDSDGNAEPNLHVIVGYIGSIEMPRDANLPSSRMQSIRSAVRRLRVEHKVHTLVMMIIYTDGVQLRNTMGSTVARYPVDKIAFSGVCSDDMRFFGIVTLHSSSSEEGSEYGSNDDYMSGSSCHVFMVDPELRQHSMHVQKARSFGMQCTVDPRTQGCLEFPRTAAPILKNLTKLYRDRQGGLYEAELVQANGAVNHIRSDSNTSNSDSGLGFGREEAGGAANGSDRVYVVEMPPGASNNNVSLDQSHWDSNRSAFVSPQSLNRSNPESSDMSSLIRFPGSGASDQSSSRVNTSNSSNEVNASVDKLNLRVMPDPKGFTAPAKTPTPDENEDQNSADNLRKSMHKLLQSRQRQFEHSGSDGDSLRSNDSSHSQSGASTKQNASFASTASSSNSSIWQRPNSSILSQGTDFTLTDTSLTSNDSKLSPRAMPPPGGVTIGARKTGAMALPVSIPLVPGMENSPVKKTQQSTSMKPPVPNKPPIPERKPLVPKQQQKTPPLPPKPRPKSTPPIRSNAYSPAPLAMEEDCDSDPGNVSSLSGVDELINEKWDGNLEELDGEPLSPEYRRFSEGFALSKKRNKEHDTALEKTKIQKSGSFRLLRPYHNKRRPTLSNSHESLVVNDAEFSSKKIGGATSITSITSRASEDNGIITVGRVASWAVGFEKLLYDPTGLRNYTEFLKKEFADENIVFWKECEVYRQITDAAERKKKAGEIYEHHLAAAASEPVNVDSQARQMTQAGLEEAGQNLFAMAQTQILQLMKQDTYPRYLKSDLYKECILAEMEGRPLPFAPHDAKHEKKMLKKGRSTSNAEDGEEKRRKSLLPWHRNRSEKRMSKVTTDPDLSKHMKRNDSETSLSRISRGSRDLADLSVMSKEITGKEDEIPEADSSSQSQSGSGRENKFCRVILPDGSTTVVFAKPGQNIRSMLQKQCERRNILMAAMEVFFVGSDKPLDLASDTSTLGSKEIKLEKRSLLRLDLPNRKVIGVKAKPDRTIREVFKPILHKYGLKLDHLVVHIAGSGILVDQESLVSTIENQRVQVQTAEDFAEWGGFGNHRGTKPPLPRSKSQSSEYDVGGDMIKDLLEGKADTNQQFDELGILDPDKKSEEKSLNEGRSSGIFGFIRRNSIGEKNEGSKVKLKNRVGFHSQRNNRDLMDKPAGPRRSKLHDPEEDKFFELLQKVQSHRLDDQRGLTAADFELPDFLKVDKDKDNSVMDSTKKSRHRGHERRNSDSSLMEISPESTRLSRSMSQDKIDNDRSRHMSQLSSFGTPVSGKIPFMDHSFSKNGVVPSHGEAENYFNSSYNYPNSPNFDDSKLMEKSLTDIGLGLVSKSDNMRSTTPISQLPSRLSPRVKTPLQVVPPRRNAPQNSPRSDSRDSNGGDSSRGSLNATVLRVSDADLDSTLTKPQVVESSTLPPPPPPKEAEIPEAVIPDTLEMPNFPPPTPLIGGKGHNKLGAKSKSEKSTTGVGESANSKFTTRLNISINNHHNAGTSRNVTGQGSSSGSSDISPRSISTASTPSPTTHDLVLEVESSPDDQGHGQGHQSRPLPPPRPPRRSPHTALSASPRKDSSPTKVKKTLIFEAGGTDVQVSQVSYV